MVQPIRSLSAAIWSCGAVETVAKVTPRALRWASSETWSVNIEHPGHGSPSLREPEVVEDQLRAALEEVGERHDPVGPLELVVGAELHHRLAPALGGEGIALSRGLLLLGQQRLVGLLPFLSADDLR